MMWNVKGKNVDICTLVNGFPNTRIPTWKITVTPKILYQNPNIFPWDSHSLLSPPPPAPHPHTPPLVMQPPPISQGVAGRDVINPRGGGGGASVVVVASWVKSADKVNEKQGETKGR